MELPSGSSNQLKGFDMLTSKMHPLLINRWHTREENEGKMKNQASFVYTLKERALWRKGIRTKRKGSLVKGSEKL